MKFISVEQAKKLVAQFYDRCPSDQRALCCMLGAIAGDNLGNYNEFWSNISENDLNIAMKMEGGGTHSLVPGQSTDDTELAISMAYGILENKSLQEFDCNLPSKFYSIWLNSHPFDLGNTINGALSINNRIKVDINQDAAKCKEQQLAQRNRSATENNNKGSQSNGGMMRISPMCVYLCKQTNQELIRRVVYAEQSLTHYDSAVLEASYVYVRMCINLIQGGSARQAYQDLQEYFSTDQSPIKQWWNETVHERVFRNAVQSMGWVRHALTQCFVVLIKLAEAEGLQSEQSSLNKKEIYEMNIRDVLRLCGDSDTNAAIVGGMIGAYLTLIDFPRDYLDKILECDLQKSQIKLKHPRPEMYNPRNSVMLCDKLLQKEKNSPIKIIDGYFPEEAESKVDSQNKINKVQNKELEDKKPNQKQQNGSITINQINTVTNHSNPIQIKPSLPSTNMNFRRNIQLGKQYYYSNTFEKKYKYKEILEKMKQYFRKIDSEGLSKGKQRQSIFRVIFEFFKRIFFHFFQRKNKNQLKK